jgi:hypothetical protein
MGLEVPFAPPLPHAGRVECVARQCHNLLMRELEWNRSAFGTTTWKSDRNEQFPGLALSSCR